MSRAEFKNDDHADVGRLTSALLQGEADTQGAVDAATTLPCHFSAVGFRRRKPPSRPALTANTTVLKSPSMTKMIPNTAN